jgi:hypothetical protein
VLAELFLAAGEAMAGRATALVEELLGRVTRDRGLTEGEHTLLLGVLVRLAGGPLGAQGERLRERIASVVLDAARRELESAPALVAELHALPGLAKALKARLAASLAQS